MSVTYIIVPAEDAIDNYTMLNQSTTRRFEEGRTSLDGTKYVFKTEGRPADVFLPYKWYTKEEIQEEMQGADWT